MLRKHNYILTRVLLPLVTLMLFLTTAKAEGLFPSSQTNSVDVYIDAYTGELVVNNKVSSVYEVRIFDLTGKEVMKATQPQSDLNSRLDISGLSKGLYLVRVSPTPDAPALTIKIMLR
ncbi:MAG: T9SS type A sorting domain-containing protein [Bacteroidales bacterium]|nr:T9SS type A sorting domain-containing protein [Bacteroidales bacterium]